MGSSLRKAHSADNWSKRPLPESWLIYAALDVDYLIELGEALKAELEAVGRIEWAQEEFAETLARYSAEPEPRDEPWRRLSGITALRTPRQYAVARELWLERDAIAARRDRPPGWIIADSAILEAATRSRDAVATRSTVLGIPGFSSSPGQRYLQNWLSALERVAAIPERQYLPRRAKQAGVPHPRSGSHRSGCGSALGEGPTRPRRLGV